MYLAGVVVSHPESIVRDKYHHYNQLMSNNYKTYENGPNFDSKLPQTCLRSMANQLSWYVEYLTSGTKR